MSNSKKILVAIKGKFRTYAYSFKENTFSRYLLCLLTCTEMKRYISILRKVPYIYVEETQELQHIAAHGCSIVFSPQTQIRYKPHTGRFLNT